MPEGVVSVYYCNVLIPTISGGKDLYYSSVVIPTIPGGTKQR